MKHSQPTPIYRRPKIRTHDLSRCIGIIEKILATDFTNFTHKSHILKAFVSRFAMFTDLKQPLVVLLVLLQKKSVNQIRVN